jgi:hypothetical protein
MKPEAIDGTYSLEEIAPEVHIPEGSMFRWRWQRWLFTHFDHEQNPDLAYEFATGYRVVHVLPPARFNREDIVRMMVLGHLGAYGWDRKKLLVALAHPYCPWSTPEALPEYLAIHPWKEGTLRATPLDDECARERFLDDVPSTYIVDLKLFRAKATQAIADIEQARVEKAARYAKGRKIA